MNKQTKLLVGVGLVAIAGFLIWKQSQKKDKKNAIGSRTMGSMAMEEGGTPTGGGASTLPAQACQGYTDGHACAFVSPRTGQVVFGHCKTSSGGALICQQP